MGNATNQYDSNGMKKHTFIALRTICFYILAFFFKYIHGESEVTVECASTKSKNNVYIYISMHTSQ